MKESQINFLKGNKRVLLSIVIPTYNRADTLRHAILSLFNQKGVDFTEVETIIVDDGSTDGTDSIFEELSEQSPFKLSYTICDHKGPAAARNVGVKISRGNIILFLGDDVLGSPWMLFRHLEFHKTLHPEMEAALLGYTPIVSRNNVRPRLIQEWVTRKQFAYQNLKHMEEATFHYFYTCNLSVKKNYLIRGGLFDENYPFPAGEDIDLGSKLAHLGLKLFYSETASALHLHPMPFTDYLVRNFRMGCSAEISKAKGRTQESFPITSKRSKLSPFAIDSSSKITLFFLLYLLSCISFAAGYFFQKFFKKNERRLP